MSITSDVEPGDVYVDECGKLYRVTGVFTRPSVVLDAVETGETYDDRLHLGFDGLMARRLVRIYRPKKIGNKLE